MKELLHDATWASSLVTLVIVCEQLALLDTHSMYMRWINSILKSQECFICLIPSTCWHCEVLYRKAAIS